MSEREWESLCDGCGRCCLHKFEDDSSGDIYFTDVACQYLDEETCSCPHYQDRQKYVPDCLSINQTGKKSLIGSHQHAHIGYYMKERACMIGTLLSVAISKVFILQVFQLGGEHTEIMKSEEDQLFEHIIHWVDR